MTLTHTTFQFALIAHRRRLRYTQSEMAQALSVHINTLAKWERGEGPIPVAMEGAIARIKKLRSK